MNESCVIELEGNSPIVTTAIHDGHQLSMDHLRLFALSEEDRLREEDPFTGVWAKMSDNHIVARMSRFEFDLNRPPEKAIYLSPSDAWGLNVWKTEPPAALTQKAFEQYTTTYEEIHKGLSQLIERFGKIVILDFHSYCHRRKGAEAPPDDPLLNPEVNIGTGTMDRMYWAPLVDRFINELSSADIQGRKLDVRENIKFRGGYFPTWIHKNFPESACCISVEFKKFFMDEWSGLPDWDMIGAISAMLNDSVPGLMDEISKMNEAS
jgi:N-formylglutamate amidohydrolase